MRASSSAVDTTSTTQIDAGMVGDVEDDDKAVRCGTTAESKDVSTIMVDATKFAHSIVVALMVMVMFVDEDGDGKEVDMDDVSFDRARVVAELKRRRDDSIPQMTTRAESMMDFFRGAGGASHAARVTDCRE